MVGSRCIAGASAAGSEIDQSGQVRGLPGATLERRHQNRPTLTDRDPPARLHWQPQPFAPSAETMAWRGKRRAGAKIHRERHIAHANASDRAADRRLDLVHKTTGATVQAGSDEGGVFEGNF